MTARSDARSCLGANIAHGRGADALAISMLQDFRYRASFPVEKSQMTLVS
jgi:hypothetical protein